MIKGHGAWPMNFWRSKVKSPICSLAHDPHFWLLSHKLLVEVIKYNNFTSFLIFPPWRLKNCTLWSKCASQQATNCHKGVLAHLSCLKELLVPRFYWELKGMFKGDVLFFEGWSKTLRSFSETETSTHGSTQRLFWAKRRIGACQSAQRECLKWNWR